MFILNIAAKLFKILRSEASPNQIAFGFVLGMIIGLTPFWSLHNLLIIILIIIFNVNIGIAIASFALFSAFAYLFDPLFHSFGYYILVDIDFLHGLWISMYKIPVLALSNFNNTVVMGSLIISIVLLLPFFFLSRYGVVQYREKLDPKFQKLKIVQIVKSTKFYSVYEKIQGIT